MYTTGLKRYSHSPKSVAISKLSIEEKMLSIKTHVDDCTGGEYERPVNWQCLKRSVFCIDW